VNLWTLLIAISSMTLLGSAVLAASGANGGVRSYVVVAISGLLLATCNAWTWSKIGDAVDDHVKPFSESQQERYLRTLYLALAIWALCAAFLGVVISSAILRLAL
jgi:hypothetical protein